MVDYTNTCALNSKDDNFSRHNSRFRIYVVFLSSYYEANSFMALATIPTAQASKNDDSVGAEVNLP